MPVHLRDARWEIEDVIAYFRMDWKRRRILDFIRYHRAVRHLLPAEFAGTTVDNSCDSRSGFRVHERPGAVKHLQFEAEGLHDRRRIGPGGNDHMIERKAAFG